MPKDNIERAIKKGLGATESDTYDEVVYEGYGPGGTAIYVEALTDNKNRTVSELRHILTKYGGNLGSSGCVAYLFEKRGVVNFDREGVDLDALLEAALEAGAEDVDEGADSVEVLSQPGDFEAVRDALAQKGFHPASAEISMRPSSMVELQGKEAETMLRVADALEDLEDVQNVYANFDISEEEMAHLARVTLPTARFAGPVLPWGPVRERPSRRPARKSEGRPESARRGWGRRVPPCAFSAWIRARMPPDSAWSNALAVGSCTWLTARCARRARVGWRDGCTACTRPSAR